MMSDLLPAWIEVALEDAERQMEQLARGPRPLRDLLATSDCLRMAGIGELFTTAQPAPLRTRLSESARAFAHGLALLPEADRTCSRLRPFFDGIAADDLQAAGHIAQLACRAWAPGKEFEEDFLFVHSLMARFFLDPEGDTTPLLERWRVCLNDTPDTRLGVVAALLERDGEAFDAALDAYLDDRAESLAESAANESLSGLQLATEHHFCVEGVALVRLARLSGLSAHREFRHVPALALAPR